MADMKGIRFCPAPGNVNGFMSFTNIALDGSGDKVAAVFAMPEDATITHVGFRYGARTGTPPTYITGLQGLDGTGFPDGTYLGGGSPASATFTPPADATWDGTWQWVALANSLAVARGDYICRVIEYSSGTISGANNGSFTRNIGGHGTTNIPYSVSDVTGSWIKQAYPVGAIKSASKTYGVPIKAIAATTVNTSGNRVSMKFNVPIDMAAQYKVIGLRGRFSLETAGSCVFGIWNAAGTAIQTLTHDTDQLTTGTRWASIYFDEASLTTLTGGVTYHVGLETDGSDIVLQGFEVESSAEMTAFPGGAAMCYSLWNGSAWSDTDDVKPIMELLIQDAYPFVVPDYRMGV